MGYGDSPAGGHLAKKKTSRKKSAKSSRAKKPCKYGPRDSEGYCPKKPRKARRGGSGNSVEAFLDAPVRRAPKRGTQIKRDVEKLGAQGLNAGMLYLANPVNRATAGGVARAVAGLNVKDLAKGGAVGASFLGAAALAGIAAYAATSWIITRGKQKKEDLQQQQYEVAQAYRAARDAAKIAQGGVPLTSAQLSVLSAAYKKAAAKLTG